jgi:hypothetical protein
MERDLNFPSKSIHEIREIGDKWNGIRIFLRNRSMKSGKLEINGTGFEFSFEIDP